VKWRVAFPAATLCVLAAGCAGSSVAPTSTVASTMPPPTTVPGSSATPTNGPATTAHTTTTVAVTSPPATTRAPALTTVTTTPAPTTTATTTTTTTNDGPLDDFEQEVRLRIESRVDDFTTDEFAEAALAILNDPRGWIRAGFTFVDDDEATYLLVLAEGPEVDEICLPLDTATKVSCQNGAVVALNADRWRIGVSHWDSDLAEYRGYLVNHEVGHLLGQRHPTPRCPIQGRPAGVMEPQTGNLQGCKGNAWPRDWEIDHASRRPVVYAPLPDWGPDPIPPNLES